MREGGRGGGGSTLCLFLRPPGENKLHLARGDPSKCHERRDDEVESICQRRPRHRGPRVHSNPLVFPLSTLPFVRYIFQKRAPHRHPRETEHVLEPFSLSLCEVINRPFTLSCFPVDSERISADIESNSFFFSFFERYEKLKWVRIRLWNG